MNRRFPALALAGVMTLSMLSACGSPAAPSEPTPTPPTVESPVVTPTPLPEPTATLEHPRRRHQRSRPESAGVQHTHRQAHQDARAHQNTCAHQGAHRHPHSGARPHARGPGRRGAGRLGPHCQRD